jgi:hypothetical protein
MRFGESEEREVGSGTCVHRGSRKQWNDDGATASRPRPRREGTKSNGHLRTLML